MLSIDCAVLLLRPLALWTGLMLPAARMKTMPNFAEVHSLTVFTNPTLVMGLSRRSTLTGITLLCGVAWALWRWVPSVPD